MMSESSCSSQECFAEETEKAGERETAEQMFVCDELSHLTDLLKSHLSRLSLKERELNERECQLGELSLLATSAQSALSAYVEEEVSKAAQSSQKTVDELRSALVAREREVERLKHSYEQARHTNQQLRRQMEDERCGKAVLERELKQVQGRVASLQTARTALTHKHQTATNSSVAVDSSNCQSSAGKKLPATSYGTVEERDSLLALLMNWLSQLLSQCSCSTQSQQNSSCRQGRQLLPLVAKLLPNLPPSHHLPLLKLTLWTIKILPEKGSLASSLRNIGRYIHNPTNKKSLFVNSSDIAIRTLSSLCLLSTLSEESAHLAALQCLLQDLTQPECRELFVSYSGVSILTEIMRPANKSVTQMAVTILTILSLHSVAECSSECCIEAVASLLHRPAQLTPDTINNLTILLQRLSENRHCWKWLMSYGIPSSLERLLDSAVSGDPHSHFRLKNIHSILNNKPL